MTDRPRIEKKTTFQYQVPLWSEAWTSIEVAGYSIDEYDAAEEIGEYLAKDADSDVTESLSRGLDILVKSHGKDQPLKFKLCLDFLPQVTVKEV